MLFLILQTLLLIRANNAVIYSNCVSKSELADRNGDYSPAIRSSVALRTDCSLTEFELMQRIGSGTSGVVFLAKHRRSKKLVAVKKVIAMDPGKFQSLRFEECTHHALNGSPFIVQHFCTFAEDNHVYFVMEYVEGTKELRPMLRDGHSARTLSDHQLKSIVVQLVDATHYIQSRGVMYRDLKSANVLLGRDGLIKLIDFGMARFIADSKKDFKESVDLDWFLLGVHIYELLTRGKVYSQVFGTGGGNKWKKLQKSLQCPKTLTPAGCDLITQLVTRNTKFWKIRRIEGRLDFLRSHPFFN